MIPDGEKIVSGYLRTHADIEALDTRIVGKTPSDTSQSWVRLTQLDAGNSPKSSVEHLIAYFFQLDCYAGGDGGQPEASLLARTVRAALAVIGETTFDDAVVSNARFTNMARTPDTTLEPARERVILDAVVRMHEKL